MSMSGLVIGGKVVPVPGLVCTSWLDDPRLRLRIGKTDGRKNDGKPRSASTWVRGIVLHTTRGIPGGKDKRPQVILPGLGKFDGVAVRTNGNWWAANDEHDGAQIIIDFDGHVSCCADLLTETAYHAGPVNDRTIGIEIAQGPRYLGKGYENVLYDEQLDAVVRLTDWLTQHERFAIQRQIPDRFRGPLARLSSAGGGGRDVVGVYGHRDVGGRGAGDPGDAIMEKLAAAGYERFDFSTSADKTAWKARQRKLGTGADGVPGPKTVAAIRALQHARGLRVTGIADVATRAEIAEMTERELA